MLDIRLGDLLGGLDAPAREDLVGVVAVVVMMVVMAAAAVAVLIMMMLVLVVLVIMVVVVMLMLIIIVVVIVMVVAAAVVILILVVVMMVILVVVLVIIVVIIVVVMVAAAAHAVLIVVMVMMLVFFFLVLVGVLLVGLGSHGDQLCLEVVLGGHGVQDLLTGQGIPCGRNDGRSGVLLAQHGDSGSDLLLAGGLGAAEDDAACVADLVIVELTEVLHIHLDLVHVGHGNEAVQLNIQMLRHTLDGAGHVAQLADARRLDHDAIRVVLLHHLLQGSAEVAHQRAADTACIQLVDLDAGLLQKAAVDADLAELVLDQNDLLARKGLFDELFDEGRLTGTKEAGENINFGHNAVASFFFQSPRKGPSSNPSRRVLAQKSLYSYYNKAVNGKTPFFMRKL